MGFKKISHIRRLGIEPSPKGAKHQAQGNALCQMYFGTVFVIHKPSM
jgi:hypothetical protein